MTAQTSQSTLKDEMSKAQDVFVLLPKNPSMDVVAAGLALESTLSNSGKSVVIACPSRIGQQEATPPSGVKKITDRIGNRNLVISLQVKSRESIDKVSYNLDEEKNVFNLVIQPKKGNPPLSSSDIDYSYAGVQADLVIGLGAQRLEDFGVFYETEKKLFTDTTLVSIHSASQVTYGMHNYSKSEASSISEVVNSFISEQGMQLTTEAASDLLFGIDQATGQLQSPKTSADTFQAVANLMKAGGVRTSFKGSGTTNNSSGPKPSHGSAGSASAGNSGVPQDWLNPKIYSGAKPSTN